MQTPREGCTSRWEERKGKIMETNRISLYTCAPGGDKRPLLHPPNLRTDDTVMHTRVYILCFFISPYTFLLEKEMAMHSSILAWRIPWTEEPGRLQSTGSQVSDMTEGLSAQLKRKTMYPEMRLLYGLYLENASLIQYFIYSATFS